MPVEYPPCPKCGWVPEWTGDELSFAKACVAHFVDNHPDLSRTIEFGRRHIAMLEAETN